MGLRRNRSSLLEEDVQRPSPFPEIIKLEKLRSMHPTALGFWDGLFPEGGGTEFLVVTYRQGHVIGGSELRFKNVDFEFPLGIVLEGRAELFEMYVSNGLAAYRPIRIIEPGELFGDFSTVDRILKLDGNSRRGEKWKICSGFKSFVITSKVRKENYQYFEPDNEDNKDGNKPSEEETLEKAIYPHLLFDRLFRKNKTIIAFFDSRFVTEDSVFFNALIRYSWERAKIYRDCLNSFNYCQKLEFKRKAIKDANKLLDRKQNKKFIYDQGVDKTQTVPLFLDALWDACNRPIRQEPMFINDTNNIAHDTSEALEWIGLDGTMVLYASKPPYDEAWFPIDATNYVMSSAAKYDGKFCESLGCIFSGIMQDQDTLRKNPRNYYKDLANQILQNTEMMNIITGEKYLFTVECIDIPSINRSHALFLHFIRKQPITHE